MATGLRAPTKEETADVKAVQQRIGWVGNIIEFELF